MTTHAPVGDLCLDDHTCPDCEAGVPPCDATLFMHPTCGRVACTRSES
jgi:hypothetical protein